MQVFSIFLVELYGGSLNLNFKSLKVEAGFSVDDYALGVMGGLRQALKGPSLQVDVGWG